MGTKLKMDDQFQEDWLDTRLREEAPYIDDDGFTAKVIQQLPARRARSFRAAIIFCITLLGSAITYSVSDGGKFMIAAVNRLASMPILFVCLIAICCGLVMTAIATGAALSKVRERTLG
jgi:CHASE2 domain-containing sensor protein